MYAILHTISGALSTRPSSSLVCVYFFAQIIPKSSTIDPSVRGSTMESAEELRKKCFYSRVLHSFPEKSFEGVFVFFYYCNISITGNISSYYAYI